jgi:hypothetical protein
LAQKLTKFKVRKVSLVSWGANDEEISFSKSDKPADEVLIFKSADIDTDIKGDNSMKSILKEGDAPPTEEEKKKKEEEEEEAEEEKKEEASKSAVVKCEEGDKKKAEEEANKAAPGEYISKSAVEALITKAVNAAVKPLVDKNTELEKSIQMSAYVNKAASELPALGDPNAVGPILFEIEKSAISPETKTQLANLLKRADAMNKAATPLLFKAQGYEHTAQTVPDSASAKMDSLVAARMGEIRKSADIAGKPENVIKAMAVAAVTKENPQLARQVLVEEQQSTARAQMGVA